MKSMRVHPIGWHSQLLKCSHDHMDSFLTSCVFYRLRLCLCIYYGNIIGPGKSLEHSVKHQQTVVLVPVWPSPYYGTLKPVITLSRALFVDQKKYALPFTVPRCHENTWGDMINCFEFVVKKTSLQLLKSCIDKTMK